MQIRKLFGRLALGLALLSPVAHGAAFQNGGIRFDVNSTATAGGTTVLTRTSKQIQVFTGSTTQTVQLPDATTLQPGYWFTISTSSTGAVAVNNNAGTALASLTTTNSRFVLISNATAAGVWDVQSAGTPITSGNLTPGSGLVIGNGTGSVLGSGTTVGIASGFYLPTTSDQTNWNGKQAAGNYITALTGDVTAAGPGSATATLKNTSVTGQPITGYTSIVGGTVTASDTILQAIGKLNGNVANAQGTANNAVTSVTGTAPIVSSGGFTPAISIPVATSSANGYLASSDWSTFNAKQSALSFISPLNNNGSGGISIPQANSAYSGYISSADWTTFNAKQAALTFTSPLVNTSNTVAMAQATDSVPGYLAAADHVKITNAQQGPLSGDVATPAVSSGVSTIQPNAVTPYKMASQALSVTEVQNIGFAASFSSGAMTVALTDSTGGALSSTNVGRINYRSASAAGYPVTRTITSAISATVPSGSTLGFKYLSKTPIYVYGVDNAGTETLGFSGTIQQEGVLATTYAFTNTSAGSSALYTTSALTGVPIRFLGVMTATETALGTFTGTGWDYTTNSNVRTAAATISPFTTEWASYTPTYTGMGTVTSPLFWRRFGPDSIQISGNFTTGTVTSAVPSLTLPNGYTVDSNKVSPGLTAVGKLIRGLTGGANAVEYNLIMLADSSNPGAIYFSTGNNNLSPTSKMTAGTSGFASSEVELINTLTVPVAQLAGSQAATLITSNPKTLLSGLAVYNASLPTNGSCIPGNYTSYVRGASSTTAWTAATPTVLPAAGQGFREYTSGAFGTADTANQPSRYDICLGAGLDDTNWKVRWGSAAGPTGYLDATPSAAGTTNIGMIKSYDKSTGILSMTPSMIQNGNMYTGLTPVNSGGVSGGYFEVELATNPLAAGLQTAQDELYLVGSTAYGSTQTRVRRYTNVVRSFGSNLSYVDDAVNGGTVTVKTGGLYCATVSEYEGTAPNGYAGIVINGTSAQGTVDIYTIVPSTQVPIISYTNVSTAFGASGCFYLNANDTLRAQTSTTGTSHTVLDYLRVWKPADPFTTAQGQSGYSGEVSAHVYVNANTAETANSNLLFSAVDYDTAGAYSLATGAFKVPANQSGHYEVSCGGFYTSVNTSYYLAKNGTKVFALANGSNATYTGATASTSANAGDLLSVMPDTTGTAYGSAGIGVQCTFKKIN